MIGYRLPLRLASAAALLLAACATNPQPQTATPARAPAAQTAQTAEAARSAQTAPAAVAAPSWYGAALTPPDAAVRSAGSIELTGTELGTMWTFENPPLEYWQRTYGFTPDDAWLDRVRLASVKIPGCSASFVSPDGLILTNHHCARGCIAANSTPETDYVETGFYAGSRDEEKVCPNAYADVLVKIDDVTAAVRAVQSPSLGSAELATATQQKIQQITDACQQTPGTVCRVVALFRGGQYQLYTYQRHAPVKLVMAPELQSGFFGGDYDNFVYPRYALDFAFYRAYEPDGRTPVSSPHYFPFDPTGPDENELVFVTGNPGSTARMITLSQLMYERSYRHPMLVGLFGTHRRLTQQQLRAATGQQLITLRERLFGIENTLKKYTGEVAGLTDSLLVASKIRWEAEFRDRARSTPDAAPYLDVWDRIHGIQLRKLELDPVLNVANTAWLGAPFLTLPGNIIALHRFSGLPDEARPAQLRGARLDQFRESLLAPVADPALALAQLEGHLAMATQWLPAGHPLLDMLCDGESPAQAARDLAGSSRILDPAFRRQLVDGGAPAVQASTDPIVRLALFMDSIARALTPEYQALLAEEQAQNQRLARALFATYGTSLPPDATSTLRISDGVVRGYEYNGTLAPYRTVFHGMFARAAEFDSAVPFDLPPAFAARKDFIDMLKPIDFVSTNDITGGNSGSPLIDRHARVVGLAFDGNIEQLPNEYVFRTETGGRTIAVHSAGILEALRSIYRAEALLEELLRAR
jgi:V8-like Glu-specific endopeptidase